VPKPVVPPTSPEIAIGPHPSRANWRVLRVSYPAALESTLNIGAAISVLLGEPLPPTPHVLPQE